MSLQHGTAIKGLAAPVNEMCGHSEDHDESGVSSQLEKGNGTTLTAMEGGEITTFSEVKT